MVLSNVTFFLRLNATHFSSGCPILPSSLNYSVVTLIQTLQMMGMTCSSLGIQYVVLKNPDCLTYDQIAACCSL